MASDSATSEVVLGARAMVPVLVGLAPAGFAVGAAWHASGLPAAPGVIASATVYGASAQLLLVDSAGRGVGVAAVALATAVVSVRLLVIGMVLGRQIRGASAPVRWVAALVLVDPAYVVADGRFTEPSTRADRQRFYLGAACSLWIGWQVAHTVGLCVGSVAPPGLAVDAVLPLCLIGLLAPRLHDRGTIMGVVAAATVAVLSRGAPSGAGTVAALLVGLAAARLGSSR